MSLEASIDALNASIQQLIGKMGKKAAPADDAGDAEPEAPARRRRGKKAAPVVTVDTVREALIKLGDAQGKQEVIDLLSRYGVKKIGDLDAEHYEEVVKAATEAVDNAGEEDAGDDDDSLFD